MIRIADDSAPGCLRFDDVATAASESDVSAMREEEALLRADDPINIQFTSGTTGNPKGATLSHKNILNNGRFSGRQQEFTHNDRVCIPVPLCTWEVFVSCVCMLVLCVGDRFLT